MDSFSSLFDKKNMPQFGVVYHLFSNGIPNAVECRKRN